MEVEKAKWYKIFNLEVEVVEKTESNIYNLYEGLKNF